MGEREAMLAAVLAEPEDDTRRFAFADWLQENGDGERAEFIRVQVELAKSVSPENCERMFCDGSLVVCTDCRKWKSLCKRERELYLSVVRSFVDGILDPHTHCRVVDVNTAQYDSAPGNRNPQHGSIIATATRGFLSAVTLRQDDFLKRAAAVFAAHPVTDVTITGRVPAQDGAGNWHWFANDRRDDEITTASGSHKLLWPLAKYLTGEVTDYYPGGSGSWRGLQRLWFYPTAEAARLDLSAACVLFGLAARATLTTC